ncbi:hypothetical protein Tco_0802721 [Tanacetum coccineum]|uniref:Uncharacterized protein n=1 Tax=Tanacetum coccineum TaxID=301880 RepID=A0ABQ5A3Z5_9ASTR
MVVVKGLSTFTRSGTGEREAHKIGKPAFKGGVTSLKVYNEAEKDNIGVRGIDRDRLAANVKVKTIEDSDYASVSESITRLPAFSCQQFKEVYKVKELMKRINAQRPKAVLRS